MILFNGKLLSEEKLNTVLEGMPDFCIQTIEKGKIRASEVLDACAALAEKIQEGVYDAVLKPLLAQGVFTERQLAEAVVFFQRENLEYKYQTELGCLIENGEYLDTARGSRIRRRYMPLGILLHIGRRKCGRASFLQRDRGTSCRKYQSAKAAFHRRRSIGVSFAGAGEDRTKAGALYLCFRYSFHEPGAS